jgi:hypothetical protein
MSTTAASRCQAHKRPCAHGLVGLAPRTAGPAACRRPTSLDEFPGCLPFVAGPGVQPPPDVIVGMLEVLKQADFTAAVDIAAHASQKLRDKLGNILTDIWSRNFSR